MSRTRVLLCDADGCLFPSEDPAFVASAKVTNQLLADLGVGQRFLPDELRRMAVGKNFRAMAIELALSAGVTLDAEELDRRALIERREVSAYLAEVLAPDPSVQEPLTRLAERLDLAVVSSSALGRLDVCFEATDLATLFPAHVRFSAEDSLPVPTSKPDPAVYALAGERLGVAGHEALAVEDSVAGVRSARAAGFPTVGNVLFVAEAEREGRRAALLEAGAAGVVSSWRELEDLLDADAPLPARALG